MKARGYSYREIGRKLDVDATTLCELMALKKAGEERLLEAALNGKIPLSVAVEIAKADGAEMQRELLKAYEAKQLNHVSIRVVKRLMDKRRFFGKHRSSGGRNPRKSRTSAESLVNTYRRETERHKLMVKKARICEAKLLFAVTALGRLTADENFVTLLRAESLPSMPKDIWNRIVKKRKEAA